MSRYVILTVYVFLCSYKHWSVLDTSTHIFLHLQIKLLEVEDAVYQTMATHSENDGQLLFTRLKQWFSTSTLSTPSIPPLVFSLSVCYPLCFVALFPYVHVLFFFLLHMGLFLSLKPQQ